MGTAMYKFHATHRRLEGCVLLPLSLLRRLLGQLLAPSNLRLDANPAKHQPDAKPLHLRQAVAEGDDTEDHGEHLAGDRDSDQ